MSGRLIHLTGREDDCCSVMRAQLIRDADPCIGHLEIDVYERNVGSLAARQLQRFARCLRRPEYGKTSLLEYRRGTLRDDCLIFDD